MLSERKSVLACVEASVLKLRGNASALIDRDERVGDSHRRRKLVIPRREVPIGIDGEGVDRRTHKAGIGSQSVIDHAGIHGRTRSGGWVNRDQAMEC